MKRVIWCVGYLFPAGIQVALLGNLHFRWTDFRVSWESPNQAVQYNIFPHHPRSHQPSRSLTFAVNSPTITLTARSEETAIPRFPGSAFPFRKCLPVRTQDPSQGDIWFLATSPRFSRLFAQWRTMVGSALPAYCGRGAGCRGTVSEDCGKGNGFGGECVWKERLFSRDTRAVFEEV